MISLSQSLREGSILIKPDFFTPEQFKEFKRRVENDYEYVPTYQPAILPLSINRLSSVEIAAFKAKHRFEAHPCWETLPLKDSDPEFYNIIVDKHKEYLSDIKFYGVNCFVRKALTEEIKKSYLNSEYIHPHTDKSDFASVVYFEEQGFNNGLAFFEEGEDKIPDMKISSQSNRLLLYDAKKRHSACSDFKFNVRYVLATFIAEPPQRGSRYIYTRR